MADTLTETEAVDDTEAEANDKRLSEVHDRALKRFDADAVPQMPQRAHALLCRRFISIPGAMWDGDWGDQFANSIKVEVDKLSRGAEKIFNDYLQNRIVPDFRPAGKGGDPETAATLDGLWRADDYHFKAQQARDNGVWEAIVGGMGAYRLRNEWADPYDKDSDDQRINPGLTIPDADQRVFFDGNSKLYDKSDARYAFVLTADTRDAFEEAYPDAEASFPEGYRPLYDWFTPDVVIKAEYYEVEEVDAKLVILTHEASGEELRIWDDELSRGDLDDYRKQGWTSKTSSRKRRRVHKYLMSGERVLKDQGYIAGACIPIVPIYGKRSYVDNMERFRGCVSKRMDSQRAYNAMLSKIAEISALAPREKPIFLAEQMPPHLRDLWAAQEKERHPYALVDPVIDPVTGGIAAMGPIGKVEPPSIGQTDATILQIAAGDLNEDADSSEEVKANTSADAMDIAATRVDAKSGIYLDNARQSVQREGEIYLDMAKEVYAEPGRTVETMSEEGDDGEAELHSSFTDKQGKNRIINDFASGKYKVICTVTEATATRRDKAVRAALATAEAARGIGDQELGTVALLTAVANQDGEGTESFKKYARRRLVAMGVEEPTDDEKREMEQAAQQQAPDPMAAVAAADAQLKGAQAEKAMADTDQSKAKTVLTLAQAHALGGPEEAPAVPDGLAAAKTVSEIDKNRAQADHLRASAAALPGEVNIEAHKALTARIQATMPANDTHAPRIRRGSEL